MTVRRLIALVAWTLLVMLCSAGVWGVIRTAGTGVTTSPGVPSTVLGTAQATDPGTSSSGPATATPRPHRRTTAPQPTPAPAQPEPTGEPADEPADEPTGNGGGRGRTGDQDPPTNPGNPGPAEVRRTWQGDAGAVVASCRGTSISFLGAQPNSGWRVEVGGRGPDQIEVHFTTTHGEDDEGEIELKARCVGGVPRFSTAGD